ncbi:MAG TPA: SMI1/KNR4 family protein [Pirellulales bacterium]
MSTKSNFDDAYSLERRMRFFSGRIPADLIPIADNGGGSQILLGIRGKDEGKVYYWDLRNEPLDEEDYLEDHGEPRPPDAMFQNVHLVAESFEDLLRRIEVD